MMSLVDRRGRKHTVSVFDVFGSGRTIRRNRRIATEQELRKANSEGQDAEKAKDKLEKVSCNEFAIALLRRTRHTDPNIR